MLDRPYRDKKVVKARQEAVHKQDEQRRLKRIQRDAERAKVPEEKEKPDAGI